MIYLHKILPFFLSPLGIIIIFLIASFFFKRSFFVFLAFIVLVISSNPIIGTYLTKKLENPYEPVNVSNLQKHDAIVVLSGFVHQVGTNDNITYEFSDPDRFFAGIELIRKNVAYKLIFTAGTLPWTKNQKPEGYILRDKAIYFGISREKILITQNVQNTYEESIALKKLLPKKSSIVLVTSAFHMHRSKYLFEKQGFKITPFPVDFSPSHYNNDFSFLSFFPSLGALNATSIFIRENIGRLYYKLFF